MILEKRKFVTPEEIRLQEIKNKALAPWGQADIEDVIWMLDYVEKLKCKNMILQQVMSAAGDVVAVGGDEEFEALDRLFKIATKAGCLEE